ncbi:MAG: hypothetical protein JHC98_06030 [Thermoleophilaceae bacterium]|nr:hypothetical protein [Thermoleophilaceae bacterium]
MQATYGIDVKDPRFDSLESVMGQIYPDLFNPALANLARTAFVSVLKLFNRRLSDTTNNVEATNKRWLYRIVAKYLNNGVRPGDLTIITFNQDIQVEKSLELMSKTARWAGIAPEIFNFPWCYGIGNPGLSWPSNARSEDLFEEHDPVDRPARILKLHGSLNWYSTHNSRSPTPNAMFNSKRDLSITCRKLISPEMTLTRETRNAYTLPVVVPPVSHKSAVLHDAMKPLWKMAETALEKADEIVVFGYSCPALDFESSNLLRRSQRNGHAHISILDPNGSISSRYIDVLSARRLSYYQSARDFLAFN